MATVLVPEQSIDNAALGALKASAARTIQKIVRSTTGADVLYRQLTAGDVINFATGPNAQGRLNNPNALVANTVAADQFANFTMLNTTAVAIWGYAALAATPLIDAIIFGVGGAQNLANIPLDELYAQGSARSKVGIFVNPIIYGPSEHVNISLFAGAAVVANAEAFQLLGYVAELTGRITTNPRSWPGAPQETTTA